MRISALYARPEPTISFEFFPPKTEEDEAALFRDTVPVLKKLNPSFISVTYGAGGGTRGKTLGIVDRLRREYGIESMAHLTCVNSTAEMIADVMQEAEGLGIENVLCLRGDPPKGQTEFKAVEGGFSYALDLIRFVKARGHFTIGAAGYPEGHVECPNRQLDWDRCAAKVEAGAEFLITQLFYDVQDFFAFADYLKNRKKVTVPIIPGVLPFLSAGQIRRFTTLCGSKIPEPMRKRLDELAHDDESVRQYGVELCTDLCRKLLDAGVPGIHLYCLNRTASTVEILRNLGRAG